MAFLKAFRERLTRALGNTEPSIIRKRSFLRRLLPPYTGIAPDTVFGVNIYRTHHYDKWWFRWTFRAYHDLLRRIDRAYYWLLYRLHPGHQYHVVRTDLAPGYYDVDEIMFRACFALLGRFVEEELGPVEGDLSEESSYRGYRLHSFGGNNEKAIDLWLWYKIELPEVERLYAEDIAACYGKASVDFGDPDPVTGCRTARFNRLRKPKYPHHWPEIVKDEKLRELIALRRTLWT